MASPRRLLVTGGAGFIGSNFVRFWRERHPLDEVTVLDALTYAGVAANIDATGVELIRGNVCDTPLLRRILARNAIDTIVHFAAESHNSRAVHDPLRFFRTNVGGTASLLEAARLHGIARFHHVSTCEVYGDLPLDASMPTTEGTAYAPNTAYSASKAGADHAVRAYAKVFELPVSLTVCSNNYGPFQFPEKLIPRFVTSALLDQPLTLYASTHYRREWTHVGDHCRALELVLLGDSAGETFNVGSGEEASIEEIADLILDELGKPASLKKVIPDRPGHDRRYLLDSTKLRTRLGWRPTLTLEQGVRETVRWYATHEGWWRPLLDACRSVEVGS